ncbi:hypothetical protein [Pseudomonas rubra]|uniref:Phage integrase family protein n=1 Tax=Pseudomonas rubra TaxID=2942627 RepID=A0ABT5PCP5_9PSED|nr:hypothetical protein [Pseudomonas rubra]MDD1016079.1 hypothetical protein [Pseudomonas rubra]MDD1039998.1 hypothetical protein [Pseudomonas rubra]MDD1156297.1 hypothetical protein [Pseudomonas rubra]
MSNLPNEILAFFDRTTREFHFNHRPSWLRSELLDLVWVVDNNQDLRIVNGEIRGGTRIRWDHDLPNGSMASQKNQTLARQCRAITVWAHDGTIGLGGNSLRSIKHFHLFLHWMTEFFMNRYGDRFSQHGFKIVVVEDLVDFFETYEAGGVTATSQVIPRWEQFLRAQGLNPTEVDKVREFLTTVNAYDKKGRLLDSYLASATRMRSGRPRRLQQFSKYLERFEGQPANVHYTVPVQRTASLARWAVILSRTLNFIPEFEHSELSDVVRVAEAVRPYIDRPNGRTATLPISVGRKLLANCCDWMLNIYPKIYEFVLKVQQKIEFGSNGRRGGLIKAISLAERRIAIDPQLSNIADRWQRTPSGPTYGESQHMALTTSVVLLKLHNAVCYVLLGMLGCGRLNEVISLRAAPMHGVASKTVEFSIQKSGIDNTRRIMAKPMPQIAVDCLISLTKLKSVCSSIRPSADPLSEECAFFSFNARGLGLITKSDVNGLLRELSLTLDLRTSKGELWLLRSHELRRYFAMSFFHSEGNENSLPALTWFMGHSDIEKTWRYVKESLTGKEMSASEAAMARAAIYSNDQTKSVCALRALVLKYFGCKSMTLLGEDEVQDYLEMMAEEGLYSASPIQIQCRGQKVFTVLITMIKD